MAMTRLEQPSSPYVDLYVGGFNLTPIPPQYLLDFSHTRNMADTANTFQFSVYDDTALELEYIIARGNQDVLFSYGYSFGAQSKVYSGMIMDYDIDFQHGGVVLNVTGTSQVMKSHAKKYTKTWKGMTPDQVVKAIAKLEGWKLGLIEPCVPLQSLSNEAIPKMVHKTFHQMNIPSTKFIKDYILPYAVSSKSGEAGFNLYFRDTSEGVEINFTPPKYNQTPKSNFLMELNSKTGRGIIKSFKPEVKGSVLMQGGGTMSAIAFDKETGKVVEITHTDSTNTKQSNTGSKSAIAYETGKNFLDLSSMTVAEAKAQLAYYWYKNANMTYPATCEMVGDPTLEPNTTTNISIITNQGKAHHTSGLYLITGITDSINGGDFTTSLNLVKNARALGAYAKAGVDENDK